MSGFIDTNVLVYAFGNDPKGDHARQLIGSDSHIAVQSLNEFALVLRRRLRLQWDDIEQALALLRAEVAPPVPLTLALHEAGLRVAKRYQLQIYDSMLLAAALSANCATFYSEDLADGMIIDGKLTVRNPFV